MPTAEALMRWICGLLACCWSVVTALIGISIGKDWRNESTLLDKVITMSLGGTLDIVSVIVLVMGICTIVDKEPM